MIDCIAVNQRTLLTCVLEGGCTAFFMLRLFRLRVKPVWLILYYAADIIFTYAVNTRFSNGLINFFMSLLAIFGYTLIFRTTLSQKIFAYTSLIIIMCFSEMIAASFAVENGLYRVSGTTSYRVVANSHYQYGLMLIISILCITSAYIMIYLLSIWVRKRDIVRDEKGFKIQDVCICIVSVLSFIILWVILVQYAEGGISTGVTIFMVVAMILIVMTFYISYEQMIKADREIMEKQLLEEEYVHKKAYYEQMERHQNEIRKIRHDLKNQLLGIMSGAGQGSGKNSGSAVDRETADAKGGANSVSVSDIGADVESSVDSEPVGDRETVDAESGVESAIKEILHEIDESEISSYTENVTLNMILNDKIRIARTKGIMADLDIKVPRNLSMDAGDLGILCGNLLDNAIEALEKCTEGARGLLFHAYYYKNSLVITCENSIAAPVTSLKTDKADKQNHGIGLKSIDEIAAK
jgi:hypothetical protein